ncbi:MAG TPA: energy transducer TonB, partial [Gemmatimonadaceae bacterium]|nr:energy transducer TonB [Gemmatimonadaceae bacterium]
MRLLESKQDKKRSPKGTFMSLGLHLVILFLAIFATARAGIKKAEKPKEEKLNFVAIKKEPPPPVEVKKPDPPKVKKVEPPKPKPKVPTPVKVELPKAPKVVEAAPPKGFKVLPPPVSVPTNLPTVDLSKAVTNEADFSGKGVAGGSDKGVKGGTGDENSKGKEAGPKVEEHTGPYMEFQVEQAVRKIGGDAPDYPPSLKDAGVTGKVLAQFVVGENGRYEPGSLKILESSNPQFTAAVKQALPGMRFSA